MWSEPIPNKIRDTSSENIGPSRQLQKIQKVNDVILKNFFISVAIIPQVAGNRTSVLRPNHATKPLQAPLLLAKTPPLHRQNHGNFKLRASKPTRTIEFRTPSPPSNVVDHTLLSPPKPAIMASKAVAKAAGGVMSITTVPSSPN